MAGCVPLPPGAGFIGSVTSYVDCQAQVLGSGAWSALAAPGSTLDVVLTGFLTLFIALIGFNLLLGRSVSLREGTLAFVKIGAVFALATSWPAYRTLIYDLVMDGPAQLVSEIGPRAGVVGADGTLLQRLDNTDRAMAELALLGAGTPPPGSIVQAPPAPFGGFEAFALGGSRILFLLTSVAGIAAVRVIAGLMLALGPFFIAFLLFDGTRGLFEGWVRVLAGAGIATICVTIALGLELALIEPWLSYVLARRMAGEALPGAPTELFVLVSLFMLVVLAALYAGLRAARAFRLPAVLRGSATASRLADRLAPASAARASSERLSINVERSRAAAIAGVLLSSSRREAIAVPGGTASAEPVRVPVVRDGAGPGRAPVPVGRSYTRRSTARVSARANRRDVSA